MTEVCTVVSTRERPDLVPLTGRWRWEAFFRNAGRTLEDTLASEDRGVGTAPPLPTVLVLLSGGEPIAMATLAGQDLDTRPDLTPWLAGVYVQPDHRGRGHAGRLITAVEELAGNGGWPTLWLYTRTAERLYARLGWATVARFSRSDETYALMRRDLAF